MLTPEQHAVRSHGIGASEIAAVAGLNPWDSPHTVWERKTGRAPPVPDNDAMLWGRYMEPAVVAMWKARTGRKVRYANRHQRTVVHPDAPLCRATPDGIVDPDATLEVKTYGFRVAHHWGEPGSDQIPEYYTAQVTWAMAAARRQRCYVVAAHDREVDEYVVQYDPELFAALLEVGKRFWRDYVATDTPPPPDHRDRCTEFLQRYYPKPIGKECLPCTPEADEYARALMDAQHKAAAAKREADLAKNRLMGLIGEAYGVNTQLGKVLWYSCKGRKTYSQKGLIGLARELGATDEQIEAVASHGSDYRVFRSYFKEE